MWPFLETNKEGCIFLEGRREVTEFRQGQVNHKLNLKHTETYVPIGERSESPQY